MMGKKFVNQSLPSRPASRKYIIAIIAIIVLLISTIAGILIYMNSKTTAYKENLDEASRTISEGVALSHKLETLTLQVWYDSLYKKKNPETVSYIKGTKDFNDALTNLYNAENTQKLMKSINDNQIEMAPKMHKLKEPPEEMKNNYETLNTVYANYKSYLSLSMAPRGSYEDYKTEMADAKKRFDV